MILGKSPKSQAGLILSHQDVAIPQTLTALPVMPLITTSSRSLPVPKRMTVPMWRKVPVILTPTIYRFRARLGGSPDGLILGERYPYAVLAVQELAQPGLVLVATAIRPKDASFSYKIYQDIAVGRLRRLVALYQMGEASGLVQVSQKADLEAAVGAIYEEQAKSKHQIERYKRVLLSLSSDLRT